MPLIAGIVIDIIGVRLSIIILSILTILGQGTYTFGAYVHNYWAMLAGRFIFGLGAEAM
jgi:MFS family permease